MPNEGPPETEYSLELVKIDFTADEKIKLGLKVAEQIQELRVIDSEKKSAAADFLAREKQASLEMNKIARKLEDGYEMRHENCIVEYDDATHMVHFILEREHLDNPAKKPMKIIVKQRKMTSSEMQRSLPEF